MHFTVSVAVAVGCALAPWAAARLSTRWAAIAAAPLLAVMVAGAVGGVAFYPGSDVVVAAFSLLAGIVVGRLMPPRFGPFFLLLVVLSAVDLAQNIVFSGPPAGSSSAPDPHFAWLNFRVPLPAGHFNIGFADLLLIAAAGENLRRRGATLTLTLLPGVIGLGLGEGLTATLPEAPPALLTAFAQSLVPFLAAGYLLTELAVAQVTQKEQA